MAGVKTVVRVRLRAPELSMAAAKRGLTSFSGELQGSFLEGRRRRPGLQVPGVRRRRRARRPSPTRSCARSSPAPTSCKLRPRRRRAAGRSARRRPSSRCPRSGDPFTADMAPGEASTLPSAEAIVIADEAGDRRGARRSSKLKILPPDREAPDRPAASRGRRSSPRSRRSSSISRTSCIVARTRPPVLGRDRPRRGPAQADGARRRVRRDRQASSTRTRGRSTRAARGSPSRSCRTPDPAGGQGARQGRRAVDRGGVAKQVELFLERQEAQDLDGRRDPTRSRSR